MVMTSALRSMNKDDELKVKEKKQHEQAQCSEVVKLILIPALNAPVIIHDRMPTATQLPRHGCPFSDKNRSVGIYP